MLERAVADSRHGDSVQGIASYMQMLELNGEESSM